MLHIFKKTLVLLVFHQTGEELRLTTVRNDTSVTISWPFPSTGFVLESTTSLNPPDWQPAAEVAATNNGRWEIRVQLDGLERYFRLRKQ